MRKELWRFALLRGATLIPVLLGTWMVLGRSWYGAGAALIAYGIYQAVRVVDKTPDAEERLFLRQEKKRRGIHRRLNKREQEALLKLVTYVRQLEKMGGDPALGEDLLDRAWVIISTSQNQESISKLNVLIASLPPLHPNHEQEGSELMKRIQRECEIIYASQAEANAASQNKGW